MTPVMTGAPSPRPSSRSPIATPRVTSIHRGVLCPTPVPAEMTINHAGPRGPQKAGVP